MSKKQQYKISCPGCGRESWVTAWNSVNAQLNPELVDKILDRSLFRFNCPSCGYTATLFNAMLFNDMKHDRMIQLVDEGCIEDGVQKISKWSSLLPWHRPTYRVVDSLNSFIEKISILRAEYDDRIIEVIKMILRPEVEKEFREIVTNAYLAISNTTKQYEFYSQNSLLTKIPFNESHYRLIEKYISRIPDKQMVIDAKWAKQLINENIDEGIRRRLIQDAIRWSTQFETIGGRKEHHQVRDARHTSTRVLNAPRSGKNLKMQDPDQETWAIFETMRGETQRAAQMYSQFHIIKAIDRFIDGWESIESSDKIKLIQRITQWLDDFEEVYKSVSREESCKHRFEFAQELNEIADNMGIKNGLSGQDIYLDELKNFRKIFLDGILGAIDTCIEDVSEMGCPYPLHSTSFEVARLVIGYDIERFGVDSCVMECTLLDNIESLRNK